MSLTYIKVHTKNLLHVAGSIAKCENNKIFNVIFPILELKIKESSLENFGLIIQLMETILEENKYYLAQATIKGECVRLNQAREILKNIVAALTKKHLGLVLMPKALEFSEAVTLLEYVTIEFCKLNQAPQSIEEFQILQKKYIAFLVVIFYALITEVSKLPTESTESERQKEIKQRKRLQRIKALREMFQLQTYQHQIYQ